LESSEGEPRANPKSRPVGPSASADDTPVLTGAPVGGTRLRTLNRSSQLSSPALARAASNAAGAAPRVEHAVFTLERARADSAAVVRIRGTLRSALRGVASLVVADSPRTACRAPRWDSEEAYDRIASGQGPDVPA
jgi:hypothetical protein